MNLRCTACVILGSLSLAQSVTAQPGRSPQTRMELLAGVRAYQGAIVTLRVTCGWNVLNPQEQHIAREHGTFTTKGEKTHWDVTFGPRVDLDPTTFHRVVAFNGHQSTFVDMNRGGAFIQSERPWYAQIQGQRFFDLAMLNPPRLEVPQSPEEAQSLSILLESPFCQVRPSLEQIGQNWCSVVDLVNDPSRGPRLTVWIDSDHGYLPMRQVWYEKGNRQSVLMEFSIDEVHQLPGGVWLPTRGHGSQGRDAWELQVDQSPAGAFDMAVNEPTDDDLFNLADHLPPGFSACNMDTKQYWTVAGRDYNAAADSIVVALANQRHGIAVQSTVADYSRPRHAAASISLPSVVAGCLFALVTTPLLLSRYRK